MNVFRCLKIVMIFLLSAAILCAGCAGTSKNPDTSNNSISDGSTATEADDSERFADFILGVGDTIDIGVYRRKTPEHIIGIGDTFEVTVYRKKASEFLLGPGDSIEISVYRHGDLSKTARINTDGNIMMPLIGDFKAAGKTVSEVKDSLQEKLTKYIIDPQVGVSVENKQNFTIETLSLSFTVSAHTKGIILFPTIGEVQVAGKHIDMLEKELEKRLSEYFYEPVVDINVAQLSGLQLDELSVSAKINGTGKIMYPLLGDIQAAGKEVYALRDEIEKRLEEYVGTPQVTIDVTSIASQEFHVLGEVESPGVFTLNRRTLVWEAIGRAGGFTDDARKGHVLLIRNVKGDNTVTALNLNVKHMLEDGKKYLRRGDVVYVPPKFIASLERFMERLNTILSPIISIERGIVLQPEVEDVLTGSQTGDTGIDISY